MREKESKTYYRPTPGEVPGTWTVFWRDGSYEMDVPFADLPAEVRRMVIEGKTK